MTVVASIVEGDGEVAAVPALLRRLNAWLTPEPTIEVAKPIRVHRYRFLNRDEEFRRMLLLASAKCGGRGWVLVLLDADDDCPAGLAAAIGSRAQAVIPHRVLSVVCANREFEAWFLASAASLNGRRGLQLSASDANVEPESVRGAKEWLSHRIVGGRYREVTDQPAFVAHMDLELARSRSRSFRKLCEDWQRLAS